MCGIIGIISNEPITENLLSALGNLEYRGYDSVGVAIVDRGNMVINKDIGYVADLKVDKSLRGTIGIGHCRWATHGGVTRENAHPFTDCTNQIAVVHNGIIENYETLRESLSEHIFRSDTDSEVIVHLIESYMRYGFETAFHKAVKRLVGSYAVVAMHIKHRYLMIARKESPLLTTCTHDVFVASDTAALPAGENVEEIPDGCVRKLVLPGSRVGKSETILSTSNKDGYPHYMLKEIHEQPSTILTALEQDRNKITSASLEILRARDVILTACGTSRFATIIGRYLLTQFTGKFSEHIVGSELHYFAKSFSNSTLVLAVSQSGETADVLNGVRLARQRGSRIVSLVNRQHSSLEHLSDITLFLNCGDEVAVASTKAFTSELVVFYLLSAMIADCYDVFLQEMQQLPRKICECLDQRDKITEVANILKEVAHIYYIGKGINFAVSGECALKLKEVSYIHAESMSAGELKHGTLSLVENGTPVIGLCPDDHTYQETISNLHEAKARGGLIIGISDRSNDVYDYWLPVPEVRDIYYPLVSVVIGQLLAYYTTTARGLNPDRPRNLAKSVTVL